MINADHKSQVRLDVSRTFTRKLLVPGIVVLSAANVWAQHPSNDLILPPPQESIAGKTLSAAEPQDSVLKRSFKLEDVSFPDAISTLNRLFKVDIRYSNKNIPSNFRVTAAGKDQSVIVALDAVLKGTNLYYEKISNDIFVLIQRDSVVRKRTDDKQNVISGNVIDSSTKRGLKGVSIEVSGMPGRVLTDEAGRFFVTSNTSGSVTLTARLIGYKAGVQTVVIPEDGKVDVNIILNSSATTLGEVVTTATGQQRRLEVGNDIVKIDAKEIMDRAPVRSVTDLLRFAQVPGVNVLTASGEPGAPTRIRMRGVGSISQSSDPAVIVDGIWINSRMSDSSIINKAYGTGRNDSRTNYTPSPLDNIDPSTIESIEIIRGPSAASLYGHEAAHGVIIITTKRGTDGPASWSYSYSRDWDSQVRAKHGNWLAYGTDPFGNIFLNCTIQRHYNLDCIQDSAINLNRFGSLLDDTGPGSLNTHRMSVRGGSNRINYNFSTSYQDNIGTRRTPRVDLIRARLLDVPLPKEIRYPGRKKDLSLSSAIGFAANRFLNVDLVVNAHNSNLQQSGMNFIGLNAIMPADTVEFLNFGRELEVSAGGSDAFNISSALTMKLQPDSWWNVSSTLGADIGERKDNGRNDFRYCSLGGCPPQQDIGARYRLRQGSGSTKVLTGRISASGVVSTPFDRFLSLTPSIRLDVKRNMNKSVVLNLGEVPFGAEQGSSSGDGALTSYDVITAGYAFATTFKVLNRMYFDLGFRQDAGSAIKRSSSSRYPELRTSWVVSEEGFFPKNSLIDLFRLRVAFGYAAVHPDDADVNGGYRYRQAVINEEIVWVGELGSIGNNKLVPERSMEFEGGFDADLLGDRAQLGFTFANKNLNNAIVNVSLPPSSGLGAGRKENISRVQNRSIEFTLNTRVIDNDLMLLQLGGSMGTVNNVIRRIGNNTILYSNQSKNRLVEGYQIGSVWERPILGYGDVNGDGYIAESEIILGDTTVYKGWNTPKFTASYNGSISLLKRNLTFSFSLSQQGPHVQSTTYTDNYGAEVVGAPLEDQALYVGSFINGNGGRAMKVSEVRLNSASISYNLPRSFAQRVNSKLIVLSLQGSNLGLWTKYSGRDPMVNSTPVGDVISDNGFTLPIPRKFAFNVRVEL